jgi:hypothetical protein
MALSGELNRLTLRLEQSEKAKEGLEKDHRDLKRRARAETDRANHLLALH